MKHNQASSTAFTVLQGVLYTAQRPKYANLVSEEVRDACTRILAASQEGRKRLRQLRSWWFKLLFAPLIERLMIPGITLHYVLRKRCIEDYTVQTIQEGGTQVINLGAGFDTLAYRLAKRYQTVNFIEIDHPATHKIKADALIATDDSLNNLQWLPVDFTTQVLENELGSFSGWLPDKPTLFILEGVLMYLNEAQVTQLLESLKHLTEGRMRLIFTFVEPHSQSSHSYGPLLKMYLKFKGEPLSWVKEQTELADFLNANGYTLQQIISPRELKTQYLPPDHKGIVHEGEHLAVAEYNWN